MSTSKNIQKTEFEEILEFLKEIRKDLKEISNNMVTKDELTELVRSSQLIDQSLDRIDDSIDKLGKSLDDYHKIIQNGLTSLISQFRIPSPPIQRSYIEWDGNSGDIKPIEYRYWR